MSVEDQIKHEIQTYDMHSELRELAKEYANDGGRTVEGLNAYIVKLYGGSVYHEIALQAALEVAI